MLALFATALLFLAQAGPDANPAPDVRPHPPIERLRERIRGRPREERARLEHHLAEFERLPPDARRRLLERARVLRTQERALGEPARERHGPRGAFSPEHGGPGHGDPARAELRERCRERGREMRARLPHPLLLRLEQAPPEERRALLERLAQRREPSSLRALPGMGERFGLSHEELRRLERLPPEERLEALRRLHERCTSAARPSTSERGPRRGPPRRGQAEAPPE